MSITRSTPLTQLPGVGEARGEKLERSGLVSAGDLLGWYPRSYEDRRQIHTVREAPLDSRTCVAAMAAEHPRRSRIRKGLELVQVKVVDHTGALHLTFFNQGYVERAIKAGEEYIFFGAVEEQGRRRTMVNPIFERADKQSFTGCIMPVYRLTAGISNHLLASLARLVLPCAGELPETLPQQIRQAHQLAGAEFALKNIHFPENEEALALARRRLAFEELFYLAVGLSCLKDRRAQRAAGWALPPRPKEEFLALLPFSPTPAQSRVMDQISADLTSGRPMDRLGQDRSRRLRRLAVRQGRSSDRPHGPYRGAGRAALQVPFRPIVSCRGPGRTADGLYGRRREKEGPGRPGSGRDRLRRGHPRPDLRRGGVRPAGSHRGR